MAANDIHTYAETGNLDGLRRAVDAGAEINAKDRFGKTALQSAIAHKQVGAVYTLLELDADVTIQDKNGLTALHYAIEHNLPQVLEALVRKCPEAISIGDKHGNQPLWTTAFNARGKYEMVSLLLQYGANPQHRNNVNLTPLDIPKRNGEAALLQLLEAERPEGGRK